ncbi:hypothetical protein QNI16_23000 [Cytophagaceae bacterium YF14B1]|uniref:Uncharacterized protein n=1 Tax=Xanthocytophaga flava TaxID=3048013 RepID=A0AAE3QU96_9BACT|nr:hypothetical protein [Xanthocytophaga flavus]MDJ1483386.1 hypothetical protein [Xanthocytophaga flavus]
MHILEAGYLEQKVTQYTKLNNGEKAIMDVRIKNIRLVKQTGLFLLSNQESKINRISSYSSTLKTIS